MEKLKEREHDFSSKLRQHATLQRLKDYIQWQRKRDASVPDRGLPVFSPVSINLDLTSACNFSCPFCVDSKLINAGKSLTSVEVKKTVDTLHSHGLLSVILIGGGGPTLHRDFGEIVRYIKRKSQESEEKESRGFLGIFVCDRLGRRGDQREETPSQYG